MNRPMMTAGSDRLKTSQLARDLEVVRVVGEQHERGEAGRADRVALGHRLGRVADRVERVGDLAHFLRQAGHLGDAAAVVGDRAVGVERDDHAGHRQHRGRGDRDAVQAGERVGAPDRGADREHRQRGRLHRHREARDHVRAVAGLRGLGHVAHRLVLGRRVVLGDRRSSPPSGRGRSARRSRAASPRRPAS